MFPALLRCGFLLSTLPFWSLAQTNPGGANTAQSDTIREAAYPTDRGGQALIFAPAKNRRTFRAVEIGTKLKIDGRLDEADWQRVPPAERFVQVDPQQGQPATFDTEVRVDVQY